MTAAAKPEVGTLPPQEEEAWAPPGQTSVIKFTEDQKALIKDTIARDQKMNDEEFALFLYVAGRRGLDPLAKQIYAIRRQGKITHQTSIDGFRAIAARTGSYAGRERPTFEGEETVEGKQVPAIAIITVYREVNSMARGFTAEARWSEYYPGSGNIGLMYRTKPFLMLAKCAEAQALRAAFPEELGGLYTGDEMEQAGRPDNVAGRKAQDATAGARSEPVDPLVEAMNVTMLGKKGSNAWGGYAGKQLNEVPTSLLDKVVKWAAKTLGEETNADDQAVLLELVESANLVMAAREDGRLVDPARGKGASPQPSATPTTATANPTAEATTPSTEGTTGEPMREPGEED